MGDPGRITSIPHALRQQSRQSEAAFGLAQKHQAAIRRNRPAIESRRHFLAANGWNIEGKKAIVMHGGCGSFEVAVGYRLDNEFLQQINRLSHTRQPEITLPMNNPG